jgi:hypothetical protein
MSDRRRERFPVPGGVEFSTQERPRRRAAAAEREEEK